MSAPGPTSAAEPAGGPAGQLRVAVIGAGPAGIYVADSITKRDPTAAVDVYDRLPVPFGLLRYGVAPDHLKMKSLAVTLQKVLDRPGVRFFGNVTLGRDVTAAELLGDYHAVAYTFGASTDRPLGIPGEDLPGSVAATDFVNWYCGHPDAVLPPADLSHPHAAVIGLGNVALDVARILIREPDELGPTDVPAPVLETLRGSKVTDVHIVGRRGPHNAKFTIKELREMGELEGVDVIVDPADFTEASAALEAGQLDKATKRLVEHMQSWTQRPTTGAPRRLHLHFYSPPVALLGSERVEALQVRAGDGTREIPVSLVLRSVGYLGVSVPGVPFDEDSSTIPTAEHRVLRGEDGVGEYAAGWIKRGATGVIGTNRSDADQTVEVLLEDRERLLARPVDPGSALNRLRERVEDVVSLEGWSAIDAAEAALGASRDCPRIKLHTWDSLLDAAAGRA